MQPTSVKEKTKANDQVNILMVDDQPAKLMSYEVILGELGENLIKATSGRQALEHLLKTDVAVVLMDVSMPELNGFELADMIRQHPRFQKTAIIFISAVHLTDLDRMKGYERGAVDYISVPVVPELLRAKVSIFAELHRKARQLQTLNQELELRVEDRTKQIHQLNSELQQRLAELETIMQVLPIGVSIAHDPECAVITGNAALSELIGMKQGENISTTGDSRALPYSLYRNGTLLAAEEFPMRRAVCKGELAGSIELEVRRRDGRVAHVLASANPLFDDSGKVRGAVGVFFDVTQRKSMEDLLRERAELLDLASEAIMVRDLNGSLLFWNSGAQALYGWTREEALGRPLHQTLQTTFPIPEDVVQRALTADGRWEGNLIQQTKDGRQITVASRQAVKIGNIGNGVVLEINRDITSQLQAEEALRKAERLAAMGRMAGIIAHEINNPLEAISNAFYLLRNHQSLDEEARYLAALAEQELSRVAHITKQTLNFYRESQQATMVSIPDILDNVLELQSRRIRLNRITLKKKYQASGVIQGFSGELKQVFLNIIDNAIQAMPQGGCLRVRVYESHEPKTGRAGIGASVCDTGLGISQQQAKRIFEPFFTTKETKGTGLGLWISKGIVQKYEGNISFRSIRQGSEHVTCFSVFLPGSASAPTPECIESLTTG
jgi:PAS domain S-box-containing protein